MGIKDLIPFLKNHAPGAFTSFEEWLSRSLLTQKNVSIAIDVPILAYKLAYISGTDALVFRVLAFAETFSAKRIRPIFVFDGNNLPEKMEERMRRAAAMNKRPRPPIKETRQLFEGEQICVELGPAPCMQPNKSDYAKMKEALENAGYECKTAKFEAEALCSYLCSTKSVDAVLTEDSDAFAYCAPFIILRYGTKECVIVETKQILDKMNLNTQSFVDLCVLLGNDFNDRIHLIGPVKSYSLLQKHGTLSSVLDSLSVSLTEEQKNRMIQSQKIFTSFCYESLVCE
jgi:flap endonuclease-1